MEATVIITQDGPYGRPWRVTVNGTFQGAWPTQTSAVNAAKHVLHDLLECETAAV